MNNSVVVTQDGGLLENIDHAHFSQSGPSSSHGSLQTIAPGFEPKKGHAS